MCYVPAVLIPVAIDAGRGVLYCKSEKYPSQVFLTFGAGGNTVCFQCITPGIEVEVAWVLGIAKRGLKTDPCWDGTPRCPTQGPKSSHNRLQLYLSLPKQQLFIVFSKNGVSSQWSAEVTKFVSRLRPNMLIKRRVVVVTTEFWSAVATF